MAALASSFSLPYGLGRIAPDAFYYTVISPAVKWKFVFPVGDMGRGYAPRICAGDMGRGYGPRIWTGDMEQGYGRGIWNRDMGGGYGSVICTVANYEFLLR
jgi:hypothetical protein